MITNIYGTSPYITVTSSVNGPYISPGAASAGLVRYHNNQTQVYDGNAWLALGGSSSVGLTAMADEALAWAIKKMAQERAAQHLHGRSQMVDLDVTIQECMSQTFHKIL